MTEKLPPLATQIVAPSQTAFPVSSVSVQEPPELKKQETAEDEEHNTIKCICGFSDDDGQTIFCETCLTWQHIACYYPGQREDELGNEDFSHSCVDCRPRELDAQSARQRQERRLATAVVEEVIDRKPKRPPTKSHKKKQKPSDLQLQNGNLPNGHEHTKSTTSHDHPPPNKKPKSSHKASQSVSSQTAKRSPSNGNLKTNTGHPPSPATTPPDLPTDPQSQQYSKTFVSSWHNDVHIKFVNVNSYKGLEVFNTMSSWLRDQDRLRRETGCAFDEVFQRLPPSIESIKRSRLIERKTVPINTPDVSFQLSYLAAVSPINKEVPLLELNGQIGFQKDYCVEIAHRWEDLTTPLPFVFFHPMLPLYIDTRLEGSKARYVRRSCKPNSSVDTYISEGSEYHFWLVSDRAIAAQEQITIPWDFCFPAKEKPRMLQLLGLGDDEASSLESPHADPDGEDQRYESLAGWASLVLSEYGGCACNLGPDCAFARFHRNYVNRVQSQSNPQHTNPANGPKRKSRKPKAHHTISPTSTGHATNSRAPSEGRLEDGPDNDAQSQSSSSRSKPPSRDMTPARQGSFDTLGILTEPTDRDKRKVAMVEDSFRRMEQQQPPRKKKRTSDGTGSSRAKSVSKSTGPHPPNGLAERRYVDAGTSRSKSHSPSVAASPRTLGFVRGASSGHEPARPRSHLVSESPRGNYCDAAVQTDPVEGEWYSEIQATPKQKKRVISLSKRLLNNRHQSRLEEEERRKQSCSYGSTTPMEIDSPTLAQGPFAAPSHNSVASKHGEPISSALLSPHDGHVEMSARNALKLKSPDLRVQMPPVPAFGSSTSMLSSGQTPLSATSPMVQSPFSAHSLSAPFGTPFTNGVAAAASPVKKKMSLSDYKSRLKAQGAKTSVSTAPLKSSLSNADEPRSASSLDTPGAVESPSAEKKNEEAQGTTGVTAASS
ncbi:PHD-finger domain-containing protein [Coniochaeta sp. 2T2.1]|nr:PHD-finger domain-containing protein [Coniochaeta sp. 2T2.1]